MSSANSLCDIITLLEVLNIILAKTLLLSVNLHFLVGFLIPDLPCGCPLGLEQMALSYSRIGHTLLRTVVQQTMGSNCVQKIDITHWTAHNKLNNRGPKSPMITPPCSCSYPVTLTVAQICFCLSTGKDINITYKDSSIRQIAKIQWWSLKRADYYNIKYMYPWH